MREIIFRGKRKDNGEWAYGGLDTDWGLKPEDRERYWIIEPYYGSTIVIPETVGQYTGLTDKSGKKIFEGDILESRASENKEDWERWLVTFYDGSFCFERELPRKRKHKYVQNLLCEDEIKLYHLTVIGNIHDNPELLKGGGE